MCGVLFLFLTVLCSKRISMNGSASQHQASLLCFLAFSLWTRHPAPLFIFPFICWKRVRAARPPPNHHTAPRPQPAPRPLPTANGRPRAAARAARPQRRAGGGGRRRRFPAAAAAGPRSSDGRAGWSQLLHGTGSVKLVCGHINEPAVPPRGAASTTSNVPTPFYFGRGHPWQGHVTAPRAHSVQ